MTLSRTVIVAVWPRELGFALSGWRTSQLASGDAVPILRKWAQQQPDKIACLLAERGSLISYRNLDQQANLVAQLLKSMEVNAGDGIAMLLGNDLEYYEVVCGARRAGIHYTPISTQLRPEEAAFIIRDSGAKALVTTSRFAAVAEAISSGYQDRCKVVSIDGNIHGAAEYGSELGRFDCNLEVASDAIGMELLYSSGTTGKPKGIKLPAFAGVADLQSSSDWVREHFRIRSDTVYLSPAPLYHTAPLRFTLRVLECGGTNIIMPKFDAELALAAIGHYRVTHSQWVPTMFFRLLELPDAIRSRYNLASHECAIHAAAPCPAEIKERMIDWWGPIIWEYYGSSERNGATCISTAEWLTHRGSVGRACVGVPHILDSDGIELGPGEVGDIYFDGPKFTYHNDAEKTAKSRNSRGWSTVGDVGYLDAEGYLYLTDRRAHTIISGGVKIYPAEVENLLAVHPAVADVAVFGVPNAEFGEEVKAVVKLKDASAATAELKRALIEFCRGALAGYKCPRSLDFETDMPRNESGKLLKHKLQERYAHRK